MTTIWKGKTPNYNPNKKLDFFQSPALNISQLCLKVVPVLGLEPRKSSLAYWLSVLGLHADWLLHHTVLFLENVLVGFPGYAK